VSVSKKERLLGVIKAVIELNGDVQMAESIFKAGASAALAVSRSTNWSKGNG